MIRERETRARPGDPSTSHEAAGKVSQLRASQARVLAMFRLYGDMDDQALMRYLHSAETDAGLTPMSPSGVRSRRSELARPNTDRLNELRHEWHRTHNTIGEGVCLGLVGVGHMLRLERDAVDPDTVLVAAEWARNTLRTEGFRSPLWDTGKRETVNGRTVIVWGLAR